MAMSEKLSEVRSRLKQAIEDYERVMREEEGDDLPQIMTHWVVIFSMTGTADDGQNDTSRTGQIRSDGMSYWQVMGLCQDAAWFAQRDFLQDED